MKKDPVSDYLRMLFSIIKKCFGLELKFPPSFSAYTEDDQRVWINNFTIIAFSGHPEASPPPPGIASFLDGGPRPTTIDG